MFTGLHPQQGEVKVGIEAVCHDCKRHHRYTVPPNAFAEHVAQWYARHPGHDVEILSPNRLLPRNFDDRKFEQQGAGPWWLDYRHNADIKVAYGSSAAYTITLTSLATSANYTAGRQSTVVSNTTNLFLDYLTGGKIRVGTGPTDNRSIRIYLFGSVNDTPTYPDVLSDTDLARTITDTELLGVAIPFFSETATDTTSDQDYWFTARGIAASFGGVVPKNHGLFVSHATGQNLNGTGGNHVLNHTGVFQTVA
jgi:hypothetical protein